MGFYSCIYNLIVLSDLQTILFNLKIFPNDNSCGRDPGQQMIKHPAIAWPCQWTVCLSTECCVSVVVHTRLDQVWRCIECPVCKHRVIVDVIDLVSKVPISVRTVFTGERQKYLDCDLSVQGLATDWPLLTYHWQVKQRLSQTPSAMTSRYSRSGFVVMEWCALFGLDFSHIDQDCSKELQNKELSRWCPDLLTLALVESIFDDDITDTI